jgi:CPA1 family monovalent cation:H+ antiporter
VQPLIQNIELLLLIAALVAMAAQRVNMPYIAGLVLAGGAVAGLSLPVEIPLTRDVVFYLLLPPLIFEAAFCIPWKDLKADLALIMSFATGGLLLSAAITAWGMHVFVQWDWAAAAAFGALIAATDPISVIATFKETGVRGRLRLLVEAESLLNDGTAAVLFALALALAGGTPPSVLTGLGTLVLQVLGGATCGVLVARLLLLFVGRTQDHLVEITFTTIAAWGSFLLAERYGASGIISCMTAGLVLGNTGTPKGISERGRPYVTAFWEFAAFAANSLIFILIGMQEARQHLLPVLGAALCAIALVTLGRAASIYPVALLFRAGRLKVKMKHQHVLFWGGLRGALALALALSLPAAMPHRADIVSVAFAVVAFSVFVQATTIGRLLRHFREIPARVKKSKKN